MSVITEVVISDLQVPLHCEGAVRTLQRFIKATQPDGLLCVGDELDATQISRWVSNSAGEYDISDGGFQGQIDQTVDVLAGFRKALGPKKRFILSRSNHGESRLLSYIAKAPAFRTLRGLDYAELMQFDRLGITYARQPMEVYPNTLLAHGDEGSMIKTPGGTAMGLARKWGMSTITGHTHKLGWQHDNDSVNGLITRPLWGFEVGHLMNFGGGDSSASYLKAGSANWQMGFGIIKYDKRRGIVQPIPVPIDPVSRSFIVDDIVWSW